MHSASSCLPLWGMEMSDNKIEELARKYEAGETLSVCDLSRLIRSMDVLSEPVQKQLQQETTQDEYSYRPASKSRIERLAKREKQAE
jgi:hypothetical protein